MPSSIQSSVVLLFSQLNGTFTRLPKTAYAIKQKSFRFNIVFNTNVAFNVINAHNLF